MGSKTQELVVSVAREVFVRRATNENPREAAIYAFDAAEKFVTELKRWQRDSVNRRVGTPR